MIIEIAKTRLSQLEEEVELFAEMGITPVQRLSGSVKSVRKALADLKENLKQYPFADKDEEIYFFKYLKPRFYALQIYASEFYTIQTNKPMADNMVLMAYYEQELRYLKRFFDQYRFLYQYFQLDGSELDFAYFIRKQDQVGLFFQETAEPDPGFSTGYDFLFGRFIAFEKLQDYLMALLYNDPEADGFRKTKKGSRPLKWTGEKINLVELAYGIYDTAQVNNGAAPLSEIIEWLEQSLDISLSRYYQVFSEIKSRKLLSKTRYLDFMREALTKHIDDADAFLPQKNYQGSGSKPDYKK